MKINNAISVAEENYILHCWAKVITHDWSKRVKATEIWPSQKSEILVQVKLSKSEKIPRVAKNF